LLFCFLLLDGERRIELQAFANDFFILGDVYPETSLQSSRNVSSLRGLDISRIALSLKSPDCDVFISLEYGQGEIEVRMR
jgi:hypothetical protein